MKTNRRDQASKRKRAIDTIGQAEVDRARSNAAGPHRLKTTYTRKTKHKGRDF
jgi:hypothetical protein